jgi:ABC-type Mn2+/Zn2+ transport system ATPase subunit
MCSICGLRDIDGFARLRPRVPSNQNILQLSGVTVRYGELTALRNVTLGVPCGSSTAVLGANGAGKSTLLRAVVGLRRLSAGEILIGDSHANHARPRLAYVPQRHSVDWDFPITVRGVVEQGRYPSLGLLRRLGKPDIERVNGAMGELGILDLAERQIRRLSGGQQQRVFLARAVAQGADIFLMDEPFAGLDLFAVEELARDLRDWEAQGRTVLAAMHDLEIARRSFTRGILLATELIADGPIGEVLAAPNIERAYRGRGDRHGSAVAGMAAGDPRP